MKFILGEQISNLNSSIPQNERKNIQNKLKI